ncbi:MAG: PAS domain S-box protein [Desertifilum sp. SIO1I2]|nr:PAS domain S-box protein [Desertifilum sp. SIO1I2]
MASLPPSSRELEAGEMQLSSSGLRADLLKIRTVATALIQKAIATHEGTSARTLKQLMSQHQVTCILIAQQEASESPVSHIISEYPIGFVTQDAIEELQHLGGCLEQIPAKDLARSLLACVQLTDSLWLAYQMLQSPQVEMLVVLDNHNRPLGLLTLELIERSLDPLVMAGQIETLNQQLKTASNCSYINNKTSSNGKLSPSLLSLPATPQHSFASTLGGRLLADIALRIRQSLNLDEILNTAVEEVRQFLQSDRVLVYRFNADWGGNVVVESVDPQWISILGMHIRDTCFAENYVNSYRNGRIQTTNDIYNGSLQDCHAHFLAHFQVRANLVVPILQTLPEVNDLQRNHLWGLLIAHQCCGPRQWHEAEVELVQQLATHLAIAIQQSELYQQLESELAYRVQVEAALRQSEERFRNLIETTSDWVWEIDEQATYTYASPRVRQVLGYEPEEIIGKTPFNLMPWEDAATFAAIFAEIAIAQQPFSCLESITRHKDGHLVILETSGVPFFDPNGKFCGYRGIDRDVTERKQAAIALQEAHQRLSFHVDNSPLAVVEWDAEFCVQRWSQQAEKIFGWTAAEAEGRQPSKNWPFVYPGDLEAAMNLFDQLLNGSQPRAIARIRNITKSGTMVYCEWYSSALRDEEGTLISILSLVLDVTDRQLALDALKKVNEDLEERVERRTEQIRLANERLRAEIIERQKAQEVLQFTQFTVDRAAEAVFWTGADGQLIYVNDAACRLVEYSRQELLKLTLRDIEPEYPTRAWIEHWSQLKQRGFSTFETHYRTQSGHVFPVEVTASYLKFKGKEYKCAFVRDISERMQAQAEIIKALETERQLSQLKSRIVSVVSHEYRTPLTTIYSSAELLEYYSHKWSEEKRLQHLHRIKSAVNHLTQLVEDVLLFNKADEEKLEFQPEAIELVSWCENLVEELQANSGANHQIDLQIQSKIQYAFVDPKLLRQILTNLLTNAIKYSPQGGIIDFILTRKMLGQTNGISESDSLSDRVNEIAIFQIRDRGLGISEEDQSQLFKSFHRGSNVGAIAGTGLGLAIVKKCVDLHKGQISVESQIGVGTTFSVMLPIRN